MAQIEITASAITKGKVVDGKGKSFINYSKTGGKEDGKCDHCKEA